MVVVRAEGEVKEWFCAVGQASGELVGNELQGSGNDFAAYFVYDVPRGFCYSYDFSECCDNVVQIFADCVFIALPGRGVFSLLKVRG